MYYLGVDGGGTKTAFVLIDEEGKLCSYTKMKSCHYIQVGFKKFEEIIKNGIKKVCDLNGCKIDDISYSFLGLPGFGESKEDEIKLVRIVEKILNSKNFRCGNDVEAGWAGSLACEPGINIVGGTGAIGFGKDHTGNSARASGWGYYCGDEGSAYWLGKKLISYYTKQADGRLTKTPLYNIVKGEFNLKRDFDLITVVYEDLEMKRDKVASIAPLLYKAAQQNDKHAINLYKEAGYEHSLTVKAIIDKLNFNKSNKILVSYSGGVFKAGKYILDPFKEYLSDENIKLIKPKLLPVTGAALYAMKIDDENNSNKRDYNIIIDKIQNEEKKIRRES
jgi:N-acetylglucosamine kinase-like BadF-type ATPase